MYRWFQICFFAFSLTSTEGFADEGGGKLAIPFKSIPSKDRGGLQKIINEKNVFLSWRDEDIETSAAIFAYLLNRPVLTSTILAELGIASYHIEKDGRIFKYDDGHGLAGDLKIVYRRDREKIYQGTYVYSTGIGMPVRLWGEWVLIIKYAEKNGLLEIDIDLYLTQEDKGIGKITKELPFIIGTIMAEKVNSYIGSVRELSELIQDDPEDIYDSLKESGEIKDSDLKEFKKIILSPK